jgi:hypothetical protein
MEFVGELLGRLDLNESSDPITTLREDEAIQLAEQLGMVSTTEALRLRNSQSLINHFLDPDTPQTESLFKDEAVSILRTCVVSFLADPGHGTQQRFIELREKLDSTLLESSGAEAKVLACAPYFFVRTTLTVLLTQLKTAKGAKVERAAGNIANLLPMMWPRLREKDKWQTGETFAIVQASNRKVAADGLRSALLKVKGFDFVPETLRSDTFRAAARAVLNAHFSYGSFNLEPKPMQTLLQLGTAIPGPAIAECFTAALCVRLGNRYGHSWTAQSTVEQFLKLFRPLQWSYYLDKVLPTDRYILEKLAYEDEPLTRWQGVVADFGLAEFATDPRALKLANAEPAKRALIKNTADQCRRRVMQDT